VLVVDIESMGTGPPDWFAGGVVLAQVSSSHVKILQYRMFRKQWVGVSRPMFGASGFWRDNQRALYFNLYPPSIGEDGHLGMRKEGDYANDGDLALYLRSLLDGYPDVILISDNPSFDISFVNLMLCNEGLPPAHIRFRSEANEQGVLRKVSFYRQVVCVWSARLCLNHMISDDRIRKRASALVQNMDIPDIKHVPVVDCVNTVCVFQEILLATSRCMFVRRSAHANARYSKSTGHIN